MQAVVRRIGAAVLGLWLVVLLTEPVPVHGCPMHDGTGVGHRASRPATDARGHEARHHHAGMAQSVAHESDAPDRPSPVPHGACLCLGDCCAADAAALPAPPVMGAGAAIAVSRQDAPDRLIERARVHRLAHRQPWPHAPPRVG